MTDAVEAMRAAAEGGSEVVLEGFHALKHALRFGADVTGVVIREGVDLAALAASLAPDLPGRLGHVPTVISSSVLEGLTPRPPTDGVLATAIRPSTSAAEVLRARPGPVIVLEDPRHLGNVGAAIRVAAASEAVGVLVTGTSDPWHPVAVRGAAGLQFALAVGHAEVLPPTDRPLVALDPDGDLLDPAALPLDGVLVFGTERSGVSSETLARADHIVRIPMREDVSSLNLATAVATTLYALRGLGPTPRWTVR